MLVLQAPLLAGLFLLLYNENVMTATEAQAGMLLWMLVIAVTWLGTSNAVREIVKERPITRREANVGLSMTAYYLSKTIVLGIITSLQVLVLGVLSLSKQTFPATDQQGVAIHASGVLFPSQFGEILFALVLAGLAAMAVGLLASALIKSSDQAMLILPMLLVAHVVVSSPRDEPPPGPLEYGSWLSSASWGMAAVASTIDLNQLRALAAPSTQPADDVPLEEAETPSVWNNWEHDPARWALDVGMLVVITTAASGATWVTLQRSAGGKPVLDRQA